MANHKNKVVEFVERTQNVLANPLTGNMNSPFVGGYGEVQDPSDFDPTISAATQGGYLLGIYRRVLQDEVFSAALEKRVLGVTEKPYKLTAANTDSAEEVEFANRVDRWLKYFDYDKVSNSILRSSLTYGIGAIEYVWNLNEDGIMVPSSWVEVDPRRIRFGFDGSFRVLTRENPVVGDPQSFMQYFVHRINDGNGMRPYGLGLGSPVYLNLEIKRLVKITWNAACQRVGMPKTSVESDEAKSSEQLQELKNELAKAQAGDFIALSDGFKAKMLGMDLSGQVFQNLITYIDRKTESLVLGTSFPTVGTTEVGKGSSDGQIQDNRMVYRNDAKLINRAFLNSVIRNIYIVNGYTDYDLPILERDFRDNQDRRIELGNLQLAVNMGLTVPDFNERFQEITGVETEGTPIGTPAESTQPITAPSKNE